MKEKGLFAVFLFSVFVLAIIKIENADAWTHLSIGREIFNLRGLPQSEPFIYPMLGKHFSYASWLFGLLLYSAYHIFNIYGVIALKAVTVTAVFYILTIDSLQPHKNYIIAIGVMTVVVIMTRPRFVERPDIFLMVFLSFSVYSLNAFLYENKKYIYLLPLLHMIWANMHVSITLMFIPFLAFIAGGMGQVWAERRGQSAEGRAQRAKIKTIALIFAASFALSLISPYFINQYTAGYDIMTSLAPLRKPFLTGLVGNQLKNMHDTMASTGIRQEVNIIELQRPRWQIIKWPYLMSIAVAASFVLNWAGVYYSRRVSGTDRKYPSLIHLVLVLPFIVLSFTAMRFVPLLGIIAGPVLARNLSELFEKSGVREQGTKGRAQRVLLIFRTRTAAAITAVWIVLYTALALAHVAPFGDNRKQFGFGINYDLVPERALRYMDKRNITGRMFNQFHWGQYITWRDFPQRSAFVDGRFNLPDDLLEKANIAQSDPAVLDELEKIYGFESVLVGYPLLNPHEYGIGHHAGSFLSNPLWALVYWDDQSLLYLKRGGRYDSVIKEDEYRVIKPADDTYGSIGTKLHDEEYRNSIIRELKRNITETGSSKGYAFLGLIYNETGFYKEAIDAFSKVRDFQPISHLDQAYAGIAYAKIKLGEEHFRKGVRAYIEKRLDIAGQEFRKSIEADPLNPAPYSNLGYIYYEIGKFDLAYEQHKKAVDIDRNFANSHFGLALVYKKWGNIEMAKKQWEEYLRIEPTGPYAKKAREDIEALSRQQE